MSELPSLLDGQDYFGRRMSLQFYTSRLLLNATSLGSRKLAQNILFFGATSLTSCIIISLSSGLTITPISFDILSQISSPSFTLSSLLVEKQWTWTIGSLTSVLGSNRSSRPW